MTLEEIEVGKRYWVRHTGEAAIGEVILKTDEEVFVRYVPGSLVHNLDPKRFIKLADESRRAWWQFWI